MSAMADEVCVRGRSSVMAAAALLAIAACAGETADTVVFVGGEGIAVRGPVEMVQGADGEMIPFLWSPGTIVVFRSDAELAGRTGRAGVAYRIEEDGSLSSIGSVDLTRSNDELAADFGLEPGPARSAAEDEPE